MSSIYSTRDMEREPTLKHELDEHRITPWIELISAAGDQGVRDRLLLECAITIQCARSAALWRCVDDEWREVLARGPAEDLPKHAAFEALRTGRLPAGVIAGTRVFASGRVALALGGVTGDDTRLDPLEALVHVFALVDAWSASDAVPGALPARAQPAPGGSDAEDRRLRHDFANVLSSLRATEDVLTKLGQDLSLEETNYFKGIVEHEVSRAGELLATAFASGPANQESTSDPTRVLERILDAERAANEAAGIRITTYLDPRARSARVALDRHTLARVVQNLVVNAREALSGRSSGRLWITLELRGARDEVIFIVEDDGPGLAPEALSRAFEAGFSTKNSGLGGFGLAIVRELVEAAGGRVEVRNRQLGGAAFTMTIPQSNQPDRF